VPKAAISPNLGLRKRMLINTLSNYGKMLISILVTVFLTRILFLGLSREEYGFWALLWSIFGYSLLLDFGFGTAVQKHTSECSVSADWDRYNRIVSTVFFSYASFAVLIALFSIFLSFNIQGLFGFDTANTAYFQKVMILFGIGSAICFPFGFFTEILRGLQKMHIRNVIQVSFLLLNFAGMALMIRLKLNLIGMVFVALGSNLLASLTMMIAVHRLIPRFRLRLRYFDTSLLRTVMGFSLFAYLITFTNLIILKTDQLVISIFGSVAMVAIYQISIRLADTFQKFSAQFLDNIGPVSATLFAAGNKSKMNQLMLQSNRLMGIISSMLIIPLVVYVKPLLNIWLELDHSAGMICAIILLVSMYILLFFRSSSVYVMLMANEHKILAVVAIIEAIANLGLSILLIHVLPSILQSRGIVIADSAIIGVALGTFIPNVILAFSFNLPKACRFAGITIKEYFKTVVARTLVITSLSFGFAVLLYHISYPGSLVSVLLYGLLSVSFYLVLTYFFGLQGWERGQIKNYVSSKLKRA
jgi:O-antigen/teichoic acid export membrane protein